jgi:hypothetical protein
MRRPAFAIAVLLLAACSLNAATISLPSDTELTRRAELIVAGTITSAAARRSEGMVMTDHQLVIDEVVKGNASLGETLVVSEYGGFLNGRGAIIPGSASYEPGEEVVVFLRARKDGTWFTSTMAAGKFRIERAAGERFAVRNLDGEQFEGDAGPVVAPADEFLRYLRDLTIGLDAKRPVADAMSVKTILRPVANATAAQYTVTAGVPSKPVRWKDCEDAATCDIEIRVNGTQGSLDGSGAVTRARNAWENEPNSGVDFSNGGTTAISVAADDDVNVVLLGSNASDQGLCDGADGCAIGWVTDGVHTYNGEQFYGIVSFDIIIRPSITGQTRLDGFVTHEFGHGLGIRHSNQGTPSATGALMAFPFPSGVGANLQLWDREAVATIYGNGLPCEAAAITSTAGGGTVAFNGNANLSVVATGSSPLNYQWYEGASGDTTKPVGSNQPSFRTPDLTAAKSYWVKVSNACGNAASPTITVNVTPCTAPAITVPPNSQRIAPNATATLTVSASGTAPLSFLWYQGALGNVSNQVANTASFTTPPLAITTTYWVRVRNNCGQVDSLLVTITVGTECIKPAIVEHPANSTLLTGAVAGPTLGVRATGDEPFTYQWYEGNSGDTSKPVANATTNSYIVLPPFLRVEVRKYWVRVTNACGSADSNAGSVDIRCGPVPVPLLSAPPTVSSRNGVVRLSWTGIVQLTGSFEVQESANATFTAPQTFPPVIGRTELVIPTPAVTTDTRRYYRVRALAACNNAPSEYSPVVSTLFLAPANPRGSSFTSVIPVGTNGNITQEVFISGFSTSGKTGTSAADDTFTVTGDQPWISVSPSSGILPPTGVTVTVTYKLDGLPTGASMGSLIVQKTQGGSGGGLTGASDTKKTTIPISVSLVTPITPQPRDSSDAELTLIIPSVGHVDGFNSHFQSDIRLANTWTDALEYRLTFTPTATDGTQKGTQTSIIVQPGETKGLNDVVKEWYGGGVAGEPGLGTLEIKPVVPPGVDPADIARVTVASSRTYNVNETGTFGQYIPALARSAFIGALSTDSAARISLQQIAQSPAYRTNVGFVEGSGQSVQLMASLFDGAGNKLKEVVFGLSPFEQRQLALTDPSLFGSVGTLADGRMEVTVLSDTGRVTSFASTLDNRTNDPLLVLPVQPARLAARRFVLPGVAELDNGAANFHTDMRIYNAASTPTAISLQYYPQGGVASPAPVSMTLQPGEVKAIDNTLLSLWNISGSGGAVAVVPAIDAPLIVTGRTFSRDANGGTYGQFIPAVSAAQAIGEGDRALEIVQLEQSDSYRTNVGLFEVTGNATALRVIGYGPDSRVAASVELVLNPNEFRQLNAIFSSLGFPSAYNGRVSVQVIGGEGRVAAYGSIVDNRTQDPTYVPAQ